MTPPFTEADLIRYALEHAKGEADMAEDLLEFFCDVVERGDAPDRAVLEYLSDCFRRIISGEKPSSALNLRRTRGQHRGRTRERRDEFHLELARAVVRSMEAGRKRDDAFERVASKHNSTTDTVQRAYESYGHLFRKHA